MGSLESINKLDAFDYAGKNLLLQLNGNINRASESMRIINNVDDYYMFQDKKREVVISTLHTIKQHAVHAAEVAELLLKALEENKDA